MLNISAIIPAGVNIAYMCTQVKAAIDAEHNKSQWVPYNKNQITASNMCDI